MQRGRLRELLDAFRDKRILVLGDLMLDRFIWGNVTRISPEAPVPVVHVQEESAYPGGAANVARNLQPFAGDVRVVGVTGDGPLKDALFECYREHGLDPSGILVSPAHETIVKTRVVARSQQVVRIDRERIDPVAGDLVRVVLDRVTELLPGVDAVILEDYAKGFVTQELVDGLVERASRLGVPITVDPNPSNPIRWSGVLAIKPNRHEAFGVAGLPERAFGEHPAEDPLARQLEERLRTAWGCRHLLVTLGEEGMLLFSEGEAPFHVPSRAREVFDVSGAGDTAIALFTLALVAGATAREAAEISNYASGIVVGKIGTATLTPQELLDAVPQGGAD